MTTFAFVSSPVKELGHGTEFKYLDKRGLISKPFHFFYIFEFYLVTKVPFSRYLQIKKKRMQACREMQKEEEKVVCTVLVPGSRVRSAAPSREGEQLIVVCSGEQLIVVMCSMSSVT
jgi:hypothetical protein